VIKTRDGTTGPVLFGSGRDFCAAIVGLDSADQRMHQSVTISGSQVSVEMDSGNGYSLNLKSAIMRTSDGELVECHRAG